MQEKIVVSLSTIPPRFRDLGKTLNCLLNQDFPADEIQVYIPRIYRRFAQHSFSIPEVPSGVKLIFVDTDLGPSTKVLYCAQAHWGTKTRIIYCDDDRLPERTWLNSFINATQNNPDKAIVSQGFHLKAYGFEKISQTRYPRAKKRGVLDNFGYYGKRINQKVKEAVYQKKLPKPGRIKFKRSGYVDIAAGVGGVSIKPEFFDKKAFEIPPILWTVDDIWLSGLLEKNGIGIWAENYLQIPVAGSSDGIEALHSFVSEGFDRYSADKFGIKYFQKKYSIWK